ncbi:MAG: methylenetetrahydrofolate reductase [Spirochaetota bacterium]|nr:methylenetetrahydrofolate reductase [Spirochaetota bacterium]
MKATEIWKPENKPTISFELFPPRSEKAAINFEKALEELIALKPDFVSVTFGAGGSTREGSYQLIDKLRRKNDLEVIAYFAGFGLGPDDTISVLDSYRDLGLDNILIVRGDPPHGDDNFTPHPKSLSYASDILKFVKPKYDFCLGAASYPEGHIDAENKEKDLDYLQLKLENGAEFTICNYFYDNKYFFDFRERCKTRGINVPIVPGIMPIYSIKMMENLAKLCGATITDEVRKGLSALPEDDKKTLEEFGIEFATNQCRELLKAGVPGLHIYTMDRSTSTTGIVNNLRDEGLL